MPGGAHIGCAYPIRKRAQIALCEEETDLSFADFGDTRRPNTAQSEKSDFEESPNPLIKMARREGFAREQSSLCKLHEAIPFECCLTDRRSAACADLVKPSAPRRHGEPAQDHEPLDSTY